MKTFYNVRNAVFATLCAAAVFKSSALNNPPYDFYSYVADNTDNPPLNYTKVCDSGVTGEQNATYVVLGIDFPITYSAINRTFNGDLVIPAYIDGLPVRKINASSFALCNLKSVHIPHTIREIAPLAFANCSYLTNVTFDTGITSVGHGAFSNCINLVRVKFPETLSYIGGKCFQGCISLTDVHFEGNAPKLDAYNDKKFSYLGERFYMGEGYYERFKIHIDKNTRGWIAPCMKGVPEKWPVDYGYMQAHETVAEDGGDGQDAVPSGFVTIITEIKGGPVAIPDSWAARFPSYTAKFGNDFTASLTKPTGKKDADGSPLLVWHDYVAGTDPTDEDDRFSASIKIENGKPVISVEPELTDAEKALRKYTVYGRVSLVNGTWQEVPAGSEADYNFFKVSVEMK